MDDEISPESVYELLGAERDVRIVDIRPTAAFRRGHVPGSESIPFHELLDEVETLAGADRVVTVCPHGKSSVQAARIIKSCEEVDARVESMAGGLDAWEYELETESESETPF